MFSNSIIDQKYCMSSLFYMIGNDQKTILVKFYEIGQFAIKFHFGVHVLVQSE